ncbi:hypothetical protein Tco_1353700 [Tanacetum coccineum]
MIQPTPSPCVERAFIQRINWAFHGLAIGFLCFGLDPYEAIRQAYLDGTDTESEPFEDPVETETPKSPHTVAPPTSLPEGTPPTLVPIFCRTVRMAVRVPPVMSRASLPVWKRWQLCPILRYVRGLGPLMRVRYLHHRQTFLYGSIIGRKDEGPTAEDEDPPAGDKGLAAGDEGLGIGVESRGSDDESRDLDDEGHNVKSDGLGLGEEEVVPEGQQRAVPVGGSRERAFRTWGSGSALESERPERVSASRQPTLTTWTDPEDGMVYIDVPAYPPPAPPVQTPPSPEWSSGSLPISLAPSVIPLPISSPMIPLTVPSPVATPDMAETKGFLTELRAQVEMQGGLIHDYTVRLEELSPALFERSLKHEQERVTVTFGVIWRPILALESWAENWELRSQLAEERRTRLELAKIVDSMRRGQESRGDS